MYEYTIQNHTTNEKRIIFGRTYKRACEKSNINPNEWEMIDMTYAD